MPTSNIVNKFAQRVSNTLHQQNGVTGALGSIGSLRQMALKYKSYLLGQSGKQLDIATGFAQLISAIEDDYTIADIAAMASDSPLTVTGDIFSTFLDTLEQYSADATSIVPKIDVNSKQVLFVTSKGYGLVLDFYTRQLAPGPSGQRIYRTILSATPYSTEDSSPVLEETRVLGRRDVYSDDSEMGYCQIFPTCVSDIVGGFSIFELAYEQIGNYEVSSAITEIVDTALNNQLSPTWIQVKLNNAREHNKTVVSLFRSLSDGYRCGGLKGALMVIYHWANSGATFSTDDDGLYTFTDNSNLVPKAYMASVISGVIGGITTVVSAIVSYFAPVIAPVLATLTSAAWGLIGSFQYDASRTKASIVDNDSSVLPWCPLAAFYGFFDAPPDSELVYMLDSGVGLVSVEVPFGYLLISRRENQQEGQLAKLKCEFHASLADYRAAAASIFGEFWSKTTDLQEIWAANGSVEWNVSDIFNLLERVLYYGASNTILANGNDGSLSDDDDQLVRRIIATNMALGTLYLFIFCNGDAQYTTLSPVSVRSLTAWCPCGVGPSYDPNTDVSSWSFDDFFSTRLVYGCLGSGSEAWTDFISRVPRVDLDHYSPSTPATYEWMNYVLSVVEVDEHAPWIRPMCGDYLPLPLETPYGIQLPQYTPESFWAAVGITLAVVVVTTVIAVVTTVKVKKYLNNVRAVQAARTEKAWSELVKDPTLANAEAYRKSAKKSNLLAKFFGGTTFSTDNYWGSESGESSTGAVSNYMYDLLSDEDQAQSSEQILKLIAG